TSTLSAQFLNGDFYAEDEDYYSNRIANDKDHLWIASHQGLIHYEKATGACVKSNALFSLADTTKFLSVYKDRANHLWVCGRHKEVMRYDGQQIAYYATNYRKELAYPLLRHCYTMSFDNDNNPYLGASYKVYYQFAFSEEDEKYYHEKSATAPLSSVPLSMDLARNGKSELALLSSRSGYKDAYVTCFRSDLNYRRFYTLSYCYASSLIADRSDKFWIASNNGLYCIDNDIKETQLYSHRTHPEVPEGWYVASDMDADGNLWFSATDFLLRYDGKTFTRFSCDRYKEARSILCDNNIVWIYTDDDSVIRFENGDFSQVNIDVDPSSINRISESKPYIVCWSEQGALSVSGTTPINRIKVFTTLGTEIAQINAQGELSLIIPQLPAEKGNIYIIQIQSSENGVVTTYKISR
ncbi:MAG: hypothetical protein ACRCSQ_08105, partial [Bacteroidales bacterium]